MKKVGDMRSQIGRLLVLGLILGVIPQVLAAEDNLLERYKKKLRPLMTRILGKERYNALVGEEEKKVVLPEIPKIVKNSKSAKIYDLKDKPGNAFSNLPKLEKQQYNYRFVKELFMATRKSKPTDEDLSQWINVLDQGGTREGIYQAMVLDDVYMALERFDDTPTDGLILFVEQYMEKYLNKGFKKSTLKQLNLFSIKRIVLGNTLDLIDAMRVKRSDVEDWYAVLSHDLAVKFSKLWKGRLRLNSSKITHKDWTERVSMDHIKGEVVIKLHKAFNSLM